MNCGTTKLNLYKNNLLLEKRSSIFLLRNWIKYINSSKKQIKYKINRINCLVNIVLMKKVKICNIYLIMIMNLKIKSLVTILYRVKTSILIMKESLYRPKAFYIRITHSILKINHNSDQYLFVYI
jgi:hypothetical protein